MPHSKAASEHAEFYQVVLFIRNCTHPRTLFRIFMKFWKEYSDIVQFHIVCSLLWLWVCNNFSALYMYIAITHCVRWFCTTLYVRVSPSALPSFVMIAHIIDQSSAKLQPDKISQAPENGRKEPKTWKNIKHFLSNWSNFKLWNDF